MTVMVDCPWCSEPVPLRDEDEGIGCDWCGIVAGLAVDDSARSAVLADAALSTLSQRRTAGWPVASSR